MLPPSRVPFEIDVPENVGEFEPGVQGVHHYSPCIMEVYPNIYIVDCIIPTSAFNKRKSHFCTIVEES